MDQAREAMRECSRRRIAAAELPAKVMSRRFGGTGWNYLSARVH
jgi:hypothetical protein